MQSMDLYLTINKHIYQNDDQKIAFVLSYMTEKEAAAWKEQIINQYTHGNYLALPSWIHFKVILKDTFEPKDRHGDALHKLRQMKQGNKTAVRQDTSALTGYPDLNSRVYWYTKPVLRTVRVCSHGLPTLVSQVLAGV